MDKKTLYFCTLFDSNYLTRGLALYLSLKDTCPDFILYVIAFDDRCHEILSNLNLPSMVVISLTEFENKELLQVKPTRTRQEYCWTCSSSSILYCMEKYNLDMCIYVDADMIFFDNPQSIIDEMGESSVLLTEQRLPETEKRIKISGIYCVQFMPFKKTEDGLRTLTWWIERCIEWCYAKAEDGKLGDQKYLDDWTTRFPGVHVMRHLGGGVAPWNMYRYNIFSRNGGLWVKEKKTGNTSPLVFYHFHSTKIFNLFGKIIAVYWPYDSALDKEAKKIYTQYNTRLYFAFRLIQTVNQDFNLGFDKNINYFRFLTRKVKNSVGRLIPKKVRALLQ